MAHITHTSNSYKKEEQQQNHHQNNKSSSAQISNTTMILTMGGGPQHNNNRGEQSSSSAAAVQPPAAAAAPVSSCGDSPSSISSIVSGSTKVWVKQSAIDAARGIKRSYSSNGYGGAGGRGGGGGGGSSSASFKAASSAFLSGGSSSSHSLRNDSVIACGGPTSGNGGGGGGAPSPRSASWHVSSSSSQHHHHLKHISCSATTATTSVASSNSSDADDSSASHLSSQGRRPAWNWTSAVLLEQSRQAVVVRLLGDSSETDHSLHPRSNFSRSSSGPVAAAASSSREVRLPSTAIADGSVVLSNDATPIEQGVQSVEQGGYEPPSDLITLTHLHEPAVIESLQSRFYGNQIYTNTGAVLLALNPFQNIRGMYGEQVMKRYWESAENAHVLPRKSKNGQSAAAQPDELPPHVYSIADAAFRSMMRQLEDVVDQDEGVKEDNNGGPSTPTRKGRNNSNQSILVSGESGAGKTVTTKFVMKYLAALSQRSVARQTEASTRAYVKVQQQHQREQQAMSSNMSVASSSRRSSSRSSAAAGFQQPSWAVAKKDTSMSSSNHSVASTRSFRSQKSQSSSNDLAALTTLLSSTSANSANSSIEAVVLQSNPILESFGNARTVRNDNSSRFGKFIEIQFTNGGQLVGANIDTYLLEKVRLVHQSSGERNYHVFYELLSGGMDSRELSQYFIAKTAAPEDFKLTASGTYDRRDGVTDRETYRALRTACSAMKFGTAEMAQIFSVTAALLHASNLTICGNGEKSSIDTANVHLTPVCHLLGITQENLDRAICQHLIQAGRENVVSRCLSRERAEKGLEALLKATYGALFSYLVRRINDSIAYKEPMNASESADDLDLTDEEAAMYHGSHSERMKPVASIGVLDIFGFESFTKNSFEQLCINYCNEALQQQFNAFVLKNEQAEYEREGIEWSFIEFPENQDVLDLIEKRGQGILSVLDDQCRAPGPSDKAFCLDVYKICTGHTRFAVSSRQHASLQFSVQHYAGPVEYTTDGFTEKNRDELKKEATDLLKNSRNEFVQDLAWIIECSHEMPAEAPGSTSVGMTPKQYHRSDSSVGRATVGGQFRRQLRNLRTKVDQTTPHYVRCLKPNDHLIPDVFDTAVVAEQLRCGGILEAVRVARAGFTQHYPHDDFCRRYRALAWREMAKKDFGGGRTSSPGIFNSSSSSSSSYKKGSSGYHRNGSYLPPQTPPTGSATRGGKPYRGGYSSNKSMDRPKPEEVTLTPAEAKAQCKDLVKLLYRKIQQQQIDDEQYYDGVGNSSSTDADTTSSSKSFSFQSTPATSSRPPSSWSTKSKQPVHSYLPPMPNSSATGNNANGSVKSRYAAWEKKADPPKQEVAPPKPLWKQGGLSTSDYAKIGIQLGKTKVFLRHKAFETLERMRSREQVKAATLLNAVFRMYLARSAYLPYRDAFRMELYDCRQRFERDDFKESKEEDFDDTGSTYRFRQALRLHRNGSFSCPSLVDKWMESKIRNAIHNPVPRHEWGKAAPSSGSFKWVLSDGIWIRNYGTY